MNYFGETLVQQMPMKGIWVKEVTRARPDGKGWWPGEIEIMPNIVTNDGADYLASRIGSRATGANTPMANTVIGTATVAATLTDADILGEVDRKVFDSSSLAANVYVIVNTWGGGADGVTSVQITEAGMVNQVVSGPGGILFNRVVFASVILADSDFLKLQLETQVHSR